MTTVITLAAGRLDERRVMETIERGVREAVAKMADDDLRHLMTAPLADLPDALKAAA